ncbi:cell surface glycoprotein CD200 receptor 1 isoform X2 [Channa argus]|uniref:cell surface glycoprotein CD200 receptor 1 isoform X2 n=1 Tax=Channa argus TaxID=215402 RepID=UPI003522D74F
MQKVILKVKVKRRLGQLRDRCDHSSVYRETARLLRSVYGNMASISTLLLICLFISIIPGYANTDFINLKCNANSVGQFGQQSLLVCVIHTTQEVSNPEIRVVTWWKVGVKKPLVLFYEGKTTSTTGYKFAEPSWNNKNMNVSLLIANTEVANDGDYTCNVITDSGSSNSKTHLQVTAKYSPPIITTPKRIHQGADGFVICNSEGGYPKGQLRWFDEFNTDWTKSSEMVANKTKNGLFHLSSTLTLKSGSIFKYTCVVYNASGEKVNEANFDPDPNSGSSTGDGHEEPVHYKLESKVVAPVVVIGSLIVGLLITLLLLRWRSRRDHTEIPRCDEEGKA